jgi:hypothetical protein
LPGQLASSGLSDWTVKTREKPGKSRQFDHERIRPRVFAFSTFFRRWNRTANAVTSKAAGSHTDGFAVVALHVKDQRKERGAERRQWVLA